MSKKLLARMILEEIEYGAVSAAETERRLNRLMDRELSQAVDRPVNTALIDLCSALLLRLHRAEPLTGSAGQMVSAVLKRLARERKKACLSRWLRPLAAAAVLVAVLAGSLGLICFHWFSGHSTPNQQQYIVEGHEIRTGKTAEAYPDTQHNDTQSLSTTDKAPLLDFLEFDPCLPEDVGGTWKPVNYYASKHRQKVSVSCTYALETDQSLPCQVTFHLTVYQDPALIPAFVSFGEGGVLRLAGTEVYRRVTSDPGHIHWSWRRGNALLSLDAPISAGLPEAAVEAVIRDQAAVTPDTPPIFTWVEPTAAPLQRQPRMTERLLRRFTGRIQGTERYISDSSLELENYFGFSFGDLDILPEEWVFQEAEAISDETVLAVIIDYASVSDPEKFFKLSIRVILDPEAQITFEQDNDGRVEKMHGADVRITRNVNRSLYIWSDYPAVYFVTSKLDEEEMLPAVSALVAGTMAASGPAPSLYVTPAATSAPSPEPVSSAAGPQQAVFPGAPAPTESVTAITAEMTRNTISLHGGGDSLTTDSLAGLSEYLSYPVPQWDLTLIGWRFKDSRIYTTDDSVSATIHYVHSIHPADEIVFRCDQFTDPDTTRLRTAKNGEGAFETIMGRHVCITRTADHYTYVWTEGMVINTLSSSQPREVLDEAVAWMLGDRSMLEIEVLPEDETLVITEDAVRLAMEEREAAGLSGPIHVTPEMVSATLKRLTDQQNLSIRSGNLDFLSKYLGFSLDPLSLEGYGWRIVDGDAVVLENEIVVIIVYEHPYEPQTRLNVYIDFYSSIQDLHISFEQDKEGTWENFNGYHVYHYDNCGWVGYLWIDGMNLYNVVSGHPSAIVAPIVDHLTRTAPAAEIPAFRQQAHEVTGEDLLKGAADRQAAGLAEGIHLTKEQVSAMLDDPSGYPDHFMYADTLGILGTRLGSPMDHLNLDRIGWEYDGGESRLKDGHLVTEANYRKKTKEYFFAHLLIFSFRDAASAFASVMEDGEGTHRNVLGYDLYSYTNGGRPGCVWYDGNSIYLLTAPDAADAEQMAEELIRQL